MKSKSLLLATRLFTCSPPPPWAPFYHSPPGFISSNPSDLPAIPWTCQAHYCLRALHLLPPLPGTPFLWTSAWQTHFIQVFDQMSHFQRPLLTKLCENFLTLQSLTCFLFTVNLISCYHIPYLFAYCPSSVLECKCHEGKNFINFIHRYITNA